MGTCHYGNAKKELRNFEGKRKVSILPLFHTKKGIYLATLSHYLYCFFGIRNHKSCALYNEAVDLVLILS
ncbi:Protein translocase subunit SecA [Gossypium arboreum]|uniref:Protein translocase subunit SecA n=1 Tax=Gossypium arboreum TaxID=29729 RepID=A0A0B0P7S8_GOSAR|nr:Protein translocase subunit SecA [Gossypium arboreum]